MVVVDGDDLGAVRTNHDGARVSALAGHANVARAVAETIDIVVTDEGLPVRIANDHASRFGDDGTSAFCPFLTLAAEIIHSCGGTRTGLLDRDRRRLNRRCRRQRRGNGSRHGGGGRTCGHSRRWALTLTATVAEAGLSRGRRLARRRCCARCCGWRRRARCGRRCCARCRGWCRTRCRARRSGWRCSRSRGRRRRRRCSRWRHGCRRRRSAAGCWWTRIVTWRRYITHAGRNRRRIRRTLRCRRGRRRTGWRCRS